MDKTEIFTLNNYSDQLRVRVCGICFHNNEVLMVKHLKLTSKGYFWCPPGGGMEFGSSAEENLIREFREETGLDIEIKKFLFVHEYLGPPLHAVELFFEVEVVGGNLMRGEDPEFSSNEQIISEVSFLSWDEIKSEQGVQMHGVFNACKHPKELLKPGSFYKLQVKT
ncbi:NUDIX domain-containing protein [Xanthovirga aplysinae]|uniref:NUDIX domain-containing protein n=1 Tax=Xanthovirga aplysinae TaxID=2529853 RepID=UPI0012BCDC4B|nr:NUDIX hydrolase [Xanthovirga aplysinae]MTI32716.1 NUDIX hydrolase [Xanthovirga aplysinae]